MALASFPVDRREAADSSVKAAARSSRPAPIQRDVAVEAVAKEPLRAAPLGVYVGELAGDLAELPNVVEEPRTQRDAAALRGDDLKRSRLLRVVDQRGRADQPIATAARSARHD